MRLVALAFISGAASALTGGVASAQQQFNGNRSVEVLTRTGSCSPAYQIPVVIQNGQVSHSSGVFGLSGGVTSRGVLRGRVGSGSMQARVVGRLSRRSGSGTWERSDSLSCSGQWRAEKLA